MTLNDLSFLAQGSLLTKSVEIKMSQIMSHPTVGKRGDDAESEDGLNCRGVSLFYHQPMLLPTEDPLVVLR